MQNTKLTPKKYLEIAKEFCKAQNENEKNKVLEPLSSSQCKKLANIFLNLKNSTGTVYATFILTAAHFKNYYEAQDRKIKKQKNFKTVL